MRLRIPSAARVIDVVNHIVLMLVCLALIPVGIVFLLMARCAEVAAKKKEFTAP